MPVLRHWVGRARYPHKAEFYVGTVQAESEMQALTALRRLWGEISPHDHPTITPIPGLLAFHPEDEK